MVPAMTERDQLGADARRREWLAESARQPVRPTRNADESVDAALSRLSVPLGLWRRGVSSALVLGQRIRPAHPRSAGSLTAAAELELR